MPGPWSRELGEVKMEAKRQTSWYGSKHPVGKWLHPIWGTQDMSYKGLNIQQALCNVPKGGRARTKQRYAQSPQPLSKRLLYARSIAVSHTTEMERQGKAKTEIHHILSASFLWAVSSLGQGLVSWSPCVSPTQLRVWHIAGA